MEGPAILKDPDDTWPERQDSVKLPEEDNQVRNPVFMHRIHVVEGMDALDKLMRYYSSWYRLKRAIAWMLKLSS